MPQTKIMGRNARAEKILDLTIVAHIYSICILLVFTSNIALYVQVIRPSGVFYTIMVRRDASFLLSLAITVFLVNAASAQEGKIAQQLRISELRSF